MIQALGGGAVRAQIVRAPWLARLLVAANDNSRPEPPPAASMRARRLADMWAGGLPETTARGPLLQAAGD